MVDLAEMNNYINNVNINLVLPIFSKGINNRSMLDTHLGTLVVVHSFPLFYCLHSAPLPPLFLLLLRQDILLSQTHIMLMIIASFFLGRTRRTLSTGRPRIFALGVPGLSELPVCQHPKSGVAKSSGKSLEKGCDLKNSLFSFSSF